MRNRLRALVNAPVSLIKGLRVTWANLVRTKTTILYPEVMPVPAGRAPAPSADDPFARAYEIAPRYRGLHGLTKDPVSGDLNCIGCRSCAKVCPDSLISMDLEKREGHSGLYPVTFTINIGPCCFCGLCAEVCPTPMRALVMTDRFEWAAYRRDGTNLVLDREDLERHGEAEVARRAGGRQWGPDGELLDVLPEEAGNPYFQFRAEHEAAKSASVEGAGPGPAKAAPAAPVVPPLPPSSADPVAELRVALVNLLVDGGVEVPAAPETLAVDALEQMADRKLRAQAKAALRKLQRAMGAPE